MKKILLGPSSFGELDTAPIDLLKAKGLEIILNPYGRKLTKEELMSLLNGVDGLIAGLETLDQEVLSSSNLKVISRCGSGMSNVDLDAAKKLGINVFNTPDGPTQAVAELTVGCLMTLIRQVPQMNQSLHRGKWDKRIGRQLKEMVVVIIGYGRIGQCTAKMLNALGAHIMVVDPYLKNKIEFPVLTLEDALQKADVMSFHCSGEEELIGHDSFKAMKQGVFILNPARGGLINEAALIENLETGKVAGAWLDTFKQEPYTGALTTFDQVLLTPHVGSYAKESRIKMEMDCVENLLKGLVG